MRKGVHSSQLLVSKGVKIQRWNFIMLSCGSSMFEEITFALHLRRPKMSKIAIYKPMKTSRRRLHFWARKRCYTWTDLSRRVIMAFMFLICWKWKDMSVARTMSITRLRNSLQHNIHKSCSIQEFLLLSWVTVRCWPITKTIRWR